MDLWETKIKGPETQRHPHLCRHIARILQDLSRVETDKRLLVAARDNATAEPAAGARMCTCDTAQWRACWIYATVIVTQKILYPHTNTHTNQDVNLLCNLFTDY